MPSSLLSFYWKINWQSYGSSPLGNPSFLLVLLRFVSFNLWHFYYDVSWSGPLCIHHIWDSLCFLDLHVYFFHQIKEVFFSLFFQIDFQYIALSLLLAPLWCKCWTSWSCPEAAYTMLIFLDFFFLLVFLISCFLPLYVLNHWFDSWLHPLYCCFPVNCSLFIIVL